MSEVKDMLEDDKPVEAAGTPVEKPETVEDAVTKALGEGKDGQPEVTAETDKVEPEAVEEGTVAKAPAAVAGTKAKPEAKGEAKPPAKDGGKPDVGEVAEDDPDAPPKGLTKKAQERFQTLLSERKTLQERLTQWNDTLQSTGTDPQQMAGLLEYSRMLNSGNPTQLRGALEMAKDAVRDISVILGEDIQTIDPLGGHQDIADRVEQGNIDRQTAIELVRARQAQASQQAQYQANQAQQASQAAQAQATGHLDQLGNALRAQDPEFAQKLEALKPTIDVIAANLPPEQWASQFLSAYQSIRLPEASRVGVSPQPLRSSGAGATSVRQTPKSALEAVTAALGG